MELALNPDEIRNATRRTHGARCAQVSVRIAPGLEPPQVDRIARPGARRLPTRLALLFVAAMAIASALSAPVLVAYPAASAPTPDSGAAQALYPLPQAVIPGADGTKHVAGPMLNGRVAPSVAWQAETDACAETRARLTVMAEDVTALRYRIGELRPEDREIWRRLVAELARERQVLANEVLACGTGGTGQAAANVRIGAGPQGLSPASREPSEALRSALDALEGRFDDAYVGIDAGERME